MKDLIYAFSSWATWMFFVIPDIWRRVFPAVTPGLDQLNVLAVPDSRSHAENISSIQSGRTMRDDCSLTLKIKSCGSTLKSLSMLLDIFLRGTFPWHTKLRIYFWIEHFITFLDYQNMLNQTRKRMQTHLNKLWPFEKLKLAFLQFVL